MPETLLDLLRRRILLEGPLPVSEFMAECLLHPRHGYYTTRHSIGAAGDFTTAPEISQMFGELLGLWAADCWHTLGKPEKFYLVEFGPGRGTLMADALRAARSLPAFRKALHPVLVEAAPRLREIQQQRLAGEDAVWVTEAAHIPEDAPLIAVGNEFLDALPIRQYVRQADGWHERCVGLSPDGEALAFVLHPRTLPLEAISLPHAACENDAIAETCPQAHAVVQQLAARLLAQRGFALFIDYGPAARGFGDSLQALHEKAFADPLAHPGAADLTAHVDFSALAETARKAGVQAFGAVPQGAFLEALGIGARAERLRRGATPDQADAIAAALHRLTAPEAMGHLFKALALAAPGLPKPAGFP